jgi:predicted permease
MNTFLIALTNVLVTLACIVPGFVLCKCKKAFADHLPTLSGILVFIGTPFLEFTSFISLEYKPEHLAQMGMFFLISLAAQLTFCLGFYLIAGKKRIEQPIRVVNIASVLGNVGYFGLPLVRAILPGNALALCCATMFIVSMNIVTFTVGVFLLTGDKRHISVRSALLNPATVGLAISLPFYFFGWGNSLPSAVTSMASNFAAMTAPLCMFIVGVRLAMSDLKKLFTRGNVYLAAALKLIAFPLFCWLLTWPLSKILPFQPGLRLTLVILAATPCASHTLNFSEIYKVNPELAANCILISTIFCFATLPLFTLLPM